MVTYESHWGFRFLAAERRQSLATAEGRGFGYKQAMSRRAAKESFAATAAYGPLGIELTALRPWLSSNAAPRLEIPKYVTVIPNRSTRSASRPSIRKLRDFEQTTP